MVRFYGFYPNKVVGRATFPHLCHCMAHKGCEFYFHALRAESPVLHQQCQLRCGSGCVLPSAVPGEGQGQISHSQDLRASSSTNQRWQAAEEEIGHLSLANSTSGRWGVEQSYLTHVLSGLAGSSVLPSTGSALLCCPGEVQGLDHFCEKQDWACS